MTICTLHTVWHLSRKFSMRNFFHIFRKLQHNKGLLPCVSSNQGPSKCNVISVLRPLQRNGKLALSLGQYQNLNTEPDFRLIPNVTPCPFHDNIPTTCRCIHTSWVNNSFLTGPKQISSILKYQGNNSFIFSFVRQVLHI